MWESHAPLLASFGRKGQERSIFQNGQPCCRVNREQIVVIKLYTLPSHHITQPIYTCSNSTLCTNANIQGCEIYTYQLSTLLLCLFGLLLLFHFLPHKSAANQCQSDSIGYINATTLSSTASKWTFSLFGGKTTLSAHHDLVPI